MGNMNEIQHIDVTFAASEAGTEDCSLVLPSRPPRVVYDVHFVVQIFKKIPSKTLFR